MKFRESLHSLSLIGMFLILLLVVGLVPAGVVQAQTAAQQAEFQTTSPITLGSVKVQIWPEYDKPSALVIYNVTLPSTVTLPATLTMRIPASAGKPNAVAWQSPDKALYEIKYDTSTAGDWIQVTFSTPAPDFRVEYYDPALKKSGAQRAFTFRWPGDYAVNNLSLEIQQPVNAANMTISPTAGSGQVSASDGLTYYNMVAGKVNAGTTFDLSVAYTKPDDTLTSPTQFQPAQANQPVSNATSGRVTLTLDQMLPWVIAGLGLLLIAAGLYWYYRTGRAQAGSGSRSTEASRTRHPRAAAAQTAGSTGGAAASSVLTGDEPFCTQCGKKAAPGDVYCRVCGTRLK